MTGVGPKALVHHFTLVCGIGLETVQLPITHGLKEKPYGPNKQSQGIKPDQLAGRCRYLACLGDKGNDPQKDALSAKDGEEAHPPES